MIDLEGKTVLPGMGDSHLHFAAFCKLFSWVDLGGAGSKKEAIAVSYTHLVRVNGNRELSKKYKVAAGDEIQLILPPAEEIEARPEDIPLDIVYEDEDLLVVNKPRGMVVHPAPGNESGTLVNALLWHCKGKLSSINGKMRPGIVHRIDKDTSGLLAVAKSDIAHRSLSAQLAEHSITRKYEALVLSLIHI